MCFRAATALNHLSCQAHGQEGSLLKVESPTQNVRAWLPSTISWFKEFCSVSTKLPLDFCLKTGVTVQAPKMLAADGRTSSSLSSTVWINRAMDILKGVPDSRFLEVGLKKSGHKEARRLDCGLHSSKFIKCLSTWRWPCGCRPAKRMRPCCGDSWINAKLSSDGTWMVWEMSCKG